MALMIPFSSCAKILNSLFRLELFMGVMILNWQERCSDPFAHGTAFYS